MSDTISFDIKAPELKGPLYWEALKQLQQAGPLVWVESHGGYWAATGHEVVVRMAQDWSTFSNAEGITVPRPGPDAVPYIMPMESDPPRQRSYRKQINPHLTAKVLAPHEDAIRQIADGLIDAFIDKGRCDISKDFARRFPGTVFLKEILGCPASDFQVAEPIARDITYAPPDSQRWADAMNGLRAWSKNTLAGRDDDDHGTPEPGDIVSAMRHLDDNPDGTVFSDHEHASGLQILVQGGIGTSASVLGVMIRVLCEDQAMQERVRQDPELIPTLIEECIRLEPPLPLSFRTVTRDVEVDGQKIEKGQKVALFFAAANRDPSVFEHPDVPDLDRPHYRHIGFGVGVHRCIGSNLARLQIRVAFEQIMSRLSPFWLPEGAEIEYMSLQARGPMSIPLEFAGRAS